MSSVHFRRLGRLAAGAAHGHLDLAEIRTTDTAVETGRAWRKKMNKFIGTRL